MILLKLVLMSIAVLESFLSFYLNTYIVVFHMKNLRNGIRLNPPGHIQLVMGVTNISMRAYLLGSSVATCFPISYVTRLYQASVMFIPFHFTFSYWLIAWLCTYYCTTITNVRHQIFTWVKKSLMSFLPHLLVLSVVVSFTMAVQSLWYLHIQVTEDNSTLGYILPTFQLSISNPNLILVSCLCSSLPFLITLSCLMVTMSSLFRHIQKVKKNGSGFAPPNLQAHVHAVRTMILFLVLCVIINVTEIVKLMAMSFFSSYLQLIIWFMAALFPLAEASIVIQSSRKLKEMFVQRLCARRFMRADE